MSYDIAIVGAGILGLSHAYAAAQKGFKVLICERTHTPLGASIRNFGFAVVSGQKEGKMLTLAKRSREIWQQWQQKAQLSVLQQGSLLLARNAIEAELLREFMALKATQYDYPCHLLSRQEIEKLYNGRFTHCQAILHNRDDQVLYSREAIKQLIDYLQSLPNITFQFSTLVQHIDPDKGSLTTTQGIFKAKKIIVCSGHDYQTLLAQEIASLNPMTCRLQMLRVRPVESIGLQHAILTGLSCIHYDAYTNLPAADQLYQTIEQNHPEYLEHGIHLLVSPTPYGDLIIGDSHHYTQFPEPFNHEKIDQMILALATETLGTKLIVQERWTGEYGAKGKTPYTILTPYPNVTAVLMRAGIGMTVGPAIAESVIEGL